MHRKNIKHYFKYHWRVIYIIFTFLASLFISSAIIFNIWSQEAKVLILYLYTPLPILTFLLIVAICFTIPFPSSTYNLKKTYRAAAIRKIAKANIIILVFFFIPLCLLLSIAYQFATQTISFSISYYRSFFLLYTQGIEGEDMYDVFACDVLGLICTREVSFNSSDYSLKHPYIRVNKNDDTLLVIEGDNTIIRHPIR